MIKIKFMLKILRISDNSSEISAEFHYSEVMDIEWSPALVIMNAAYAITLAGLAVRNILLLRLLMISAQIILITTGLVLGNAIIVFWNSVFIIINFIQVTILFKEKKPVRIPERLQDIYRDRFSQMSEREFLRFWAIGAKKIILGGSIIEEGERPDSVYIITEGQALVKHNMNTIALLGRGDFIGEMSFISGKTASADVVTDEQISLHTWKRADLALLNERDHGAWIKVQQALGHDLVAKVTSLNRKFPGKS